MRRSPDLSQTVTPLYKLETISWTFIVQRGATWVKSFYFFFLICKKLILIEIQKCRHSFCKSSSLRAPKFLVAKVSCAATGLMTPHWIPCWDYQSRGGQALNILPVPTALERSALEQGIQDALELGCKCWAQALLLWELLSSTKSLQETTSKVQAAGNSRFVFESDLYLSIWQDWNWFQLRGLSYPCSSGFQCCFELRFEWKKIKKQRRGGAAGGRNEMSFFPPRCLTGPG